MASYLIWSLDCLLWIYVSTGSRDIWMGKCVEYPPLLVLGWEAAKLWSSGSPNCCRFVSNDRGRGIFYRFYLCFSCLQQLVARVFLAMFSSEAFLRWKIFPWTGPGCWLGCPLEVETKVKRGFAKVSIVSYCRMFLMIIASASNFTSTYCGVNIHLA